MNRSWNHRYPEQSTRQKERGRRYENHLSHTGHVTHGLKRGAERGLVAKPKTARA